MPTRTRPAPPTIIVAVPAAVSEGSRHDEWLAGMLEAAVDDIVARNGHDGHARLDVTVAAARRLPWLDTVEYRLEVACTCGHAETLDIDVDEPVR